jgi:hypothetical protein
MSTRSAIIAKIGNEYKGIYCHFDGYPSYVGRILLDHYTDAAKVEELINLGALSQLGERVNPVGPHSYANPEEGTTIAYTRDRGDELWAANVGPTIEAVEQQIGHNGHVYIFEDGNWTHNGEPLADVLAAEIS